MFVINVGRIRPAKATSGGKNPEKAEIMIIGMAKPTAPLTRPAPKVIAIAAPICHAARPAQKSNAAPL
jgi:hypothetical protein